MSSKHGGPWLEREDFGDVTVVRVKAPRPDDDDTTRDLFGQVHTLVRGVGRRRLVLNLAGPRSLPSLALGKLVLLNREAQAAQGGLALCGLTPAAAKALEDTHLAPLFRIYATEEEAVRSLA
jgi:anti-anti-sigma regulatory factor